VLCEHKDTGRYKLFDWILYRKAKLLMLKNAVHSEEKYGTKYFVRMGTLLCHY
jgi:hypothetical protein